MKKLFALGLFIFLNIQLYSQREKIEYLYNNIINRTIEKYYDIEDDKRVYKFDYTANGYVKNITDEEFQSSKKIIDSFLVNSLFKPKFISNVNEVFLNRLTLREFYYDKYNPILDYYPEFNGSFIDTIQVKNVFKELLNSGYVKTPIYTYFPNSSINDNIDSLYKKIILSKKINDQNRTMLYNEIIKYTTDTIWTLKRLLQFEDFVYKNYPKENNKTRLQMLNNYFDILRKLQGRYDNDLADLFLMLSEAYGNIGETYLSYKANLYALYYSNMKIKKPYCYTQFDYMPIKRFSCIFNDNLTNNYYLTNIFSNTLANYSDKFEFKIPFINQYENGNWHTFPNYDFLIERGCVEYKKLSNYYMFKDSIKDYAMVNILMKTITYYNYALKDSFNLSSSSISMLNEAFAYYISRFHPKDKNLLLYYQEKALDYSLDNFDYYQYQKTLYPYLNNLIDFGYFELANQIINNFSSVAYIINDPKSNSYTGYYAFKSYLKQNKLDSALLLKNVLKTNADTFNLFYDKWSSYKAELDWANRFNDTINIEKYTNRLKYEEYIPINDYGEIIKIEEDFKKEIAEDNYYTTLENKNKKLDSLNEILKQSNTELQKINKELVKQKNTVELQNKQLKSNDTLIKRQRDSLQTSLDSITTLNENLLQTISDKSDLYDKLKAEKDEVKNQKFWKTVILSLFLAAINILLVVLGYWIFLGKAKIEEIKLKSIEEENKALNAQSNLDLRLLDYHNFKGLTSGVTLIEQNKYTQAMLLLEETTDYAEQLFDNSTKEYVSINDEIKLAERYFNMCKTEEEFKYSMICPDELDLIKFKTIKIPHGILQPLIENSIKHANLDDDGMIKIDVYQNNNGSTILEVLDTGNPKSDSNGNKINRKSSTIILKEVFENYKKTKKFNIDFNEYNHFSDGTIFKGKTSYVIN